MAVSFGTGAALLTRDNIVCPVGGYNLHSETQLEVEGLADLNQRDSGAYTGDTSYVAQSIPTADGPRTA